MGYTHYWDHTGFTEFQWGQLCLNTQKILENTTGRLVQYEYDDSEPAQVDHKAICFNGRGEYGHETFELTRKCTEFAFCKTAKKPYDAVVVAVLIAAKDANPEGFNWQSDGEGTRWLKHDANILLQGIL